MTTTLQNPQLPGERFFWQAGPTGVLLCHGFTATTAEVRPLAQALFQSGYTVNAPLLPGHGVKPQDANQYTWKDWATTIAEAYTELKQSCTRIFLAGESLGGLLALYLAANGAETAGLLLYAPAIHLRSPAASLLAPLLSPFMSTKKKPRPTPSAADLLWQGYTVYPLKALRQLLKFQKITLTHLYRITQPLLIVQGRLDRSVHPDGPDQILRNVASSDKQIIWLEQSGHCVVLECEREQVNQLTLQFIRSHTIKSS